MIMIDPALYLSFKELILKGKFKRKQGELEDMLQALESAGRLTARQREFLLLLARDGRTSGITEKGR
jgi:hypothetical protein